jgi:hypothetical protein
MPRIFHDETVNGSPGSAVSQVVESDSVLQATHFVGTFQSGIRCDLREGDAQELLVSRGGSLAEIFGGPFQNVR